MLQGLRLSAAIAALSCALGLAPAAAQEKTYPAKPITLVIPFAPGGSVDAVVRTLKPHLDERLKQPIVVDYRGGAATTIGTGVVARAPADGYTIGVVVDAHTVNPSLYKDLTYNTFTDFAPVTLMGTMPLVVAVNASSEFDTLAKLVAVAKAKPKALAYGTVGTGSINHLAVELFSRAAGIELTHAPYRGGGPAVTDLLGGHIHLMLMSATLAKPQIDAGKFRALAVTSKERLPTLPNVPTVAESGYPGFEAFAWQGIVAPAKTPPAIVDRLQKETKAVLDLPEVRKQLGELGFVVAASTPAEFAAFIKSDAEHWAKVIETANVKPEN
ncbi:tripartite tricarboxylate transporter substrate binding protein [Bosea caraganae]|uniref:Tripartite tricarboxylate transporter substrate binding protein n=1 Tax=Bosea caraganae TaxID=2763117 RepID=A0A370KXQ3_9HYPH|nr:tripartite tricarboxylate transporter substrate binding protein [Bosea caraganae]RDJ19773.1 tripartite tricarboxylate transporter substrate binding protein [Bosea caraganae]RDJ21124.1 tripartite tricarboxylate transporter substrate binding protein [Bosea caraganae]